MRQIVLRLLSAFLVLALIVLLFSILVSQNIQLSEFCNESKAFYSFLYFSNSGYAC